MYTRALGPSHCSALLAERAHYKISPTSHSTNADCLRAGRLRARWYPNLRFLSWSPGVLVDPTLPPIFWPRARLPKGPLRALCIDIGRAATEVRFETSPREVKTALGSVLGALVRLQAISKWHRLAFQGPLAGWIQASPLPLGAALSPLGGCSLTSQAGS